SEEDDEHEDHRGIAENARVASRSGAGDPARESRQQKEVEEERRERARGRLAPVEPAQREREESHAGVDRLAAPLGGGDLHATGDARPERYSARGSRKCRIGRPVARSYFPVSSTESAGRRAGRARVAESIGTTSTPEAGSRATISCANSNHETAPRLAKW